MSRQGFGLHILWCARYFVHWTRKKEKLSIAKIIWHYWCVWRKKSPKNSHKWRKKCSFKFCLKVVLGLGLIEWCFKPITKIIDYQLDIKLEQLTQEELNIVLRKIKNRKTASFDEIPPEAWKTRKFNDLLLQYCNAVYNQNTIERWTKGCILSFPEKSDIIIAKNYWGITFTSILAKIYNALLLNHIKPEIKKILRKNKLVFGETNQQNHRFWQSVKS